MYIVLTILGIIFLFLDLIKKHIIKLTFACAFLFDAIITFKYPKNYILQLTCFLLFFSVSFILIKTILKKEQIDLEKENSAKDCIGKSAIVVKDIGKTLSIDGIGMIKFNNNQWSAKSINDKEIKAGTIVEIVSKENMIMNVKVLENADK